MTCRDKNSQRRGLRVARVRVRSALTSLVGLVVAATLLWAAGDTPAGAASVGRPAQKVTPAVAATVPPDCNPNESLSKVNVAVPPTPEFPAGDPPVDCGPNVVVSDIGDNLWNDMTGYSWHSGGGDCPIGRSDLRVVHVNYWGFDGHRYRGAIVVRQGYAGTVGDIFSDLYGMGFRIRRMEPLGSQFGHTPNGYPGADDRESMQKDNTSGFNCRYVTYDEASHNWSPHRCGWAIDVNPWENPEATDVGPKPDSYYYDLDHRTSYGSMTSSSDPAVKAFTDRGFTWLGRSDYQHFGIRNYSACTL